MHPRVLIVGTVPYNRQTTARAFESYFSRWEKENLAQIFSDPREPVKGHCGSLYQITDRRMLKRHTSKAVDTGVIYRYEDLPDSWVSKSSDGEGSIISRLYRLGSRKFPLNHLLRGILWRKKFWCTDKLIQWLDEFQPECVFLAFSDDYFIPQIALYVAERFDVPIVSCIGDDYYFNDRESISPFYYLYRGTYKKLIDRVFVHGGSAAYIGDKIRDKYNSEFGLNGETVYLTSEMKRHPFRPINKEEPYISYCGNVRLGRNHSLCMIATALGEINPDYKLHVFSNETEEQYYGELKKHPNIEFHGAVPYSEIIKIMDKSDILVVVEGFDDKDVSITRYSLSTKVADSLAVGGAVLALGSIECGAIEYMKQIDCGSVCTDAKQLKKKLEKLFGDVDYQKRNYRKCIEISARNHSLDSSNTVFERIVDDAILYYEDKRNGIKR